MKSIHRAKPSSSRSGTAATELAITFPLLMLFLLGCVDFARIGFHGIVLANAVGTAAHYAASHRVTERNESRWNADVEAIIQAELESIPQFDENDLSIDVDVIEEANGDVRVSVWAHYPFQTVVDWPTIPNVVDVSRTFEFRQFQ